MTAPADRWRRCTSCRTELEFEQPYWRCSVSTCNRKSAPLVFCSQPCWEAHRETANHRDAWAEPTRAPSPAQWHDEQALRRAKQEGRPQADPATAQVRRGDHATRLGKGEVLVVASKVKAYVHQRAGMNVSDNLLGALSDHLRELCDEAATSAARAGRKTLMDRDLVERFAPERRSRATGEVTEDSQGDPLVVVSKLKGYVKSAHDMNTSDGLLPELSTHLRHVLRQAIRRAGQHDRRTVMDRDLLWLFDPE